MLGMDKLEYIMQPNEYKETSKEPKKIKRKPNVPWETLRESYGTLRIL